MNGKSIMFGQNLWVELIVTGTHVLYPAERIEIGGHMAKNGENFPTPFEVWSACIFRSICHGIFAIHSNELMHESSWDENVYCLQDSSGSRGAVAFGNNHDFFAVFYMEESLRSPFPNNVPPDFVSEMSNVADDLVSLKGLAYEYMLDEYLGELTAISTSSFWSEDGNSKSFEDWQSVRVNGASMLDVGLNIRKDQIATQFGFRDVEVDMIFHLHKLRTHQGTIAIDVDWFRDSISTEGKLDFGECVSQLDAAGFVFQKS